MHLRDRRIIAFARREGSSRSRRRSAAHLERCPACRARLGRLAAIRDAVRDATAVQAPDRFDDVLARLDAGEVVMLPAAEASPARPRVPRRAAVALAVLALSAAAAVAAVTVLVPSASSPDADSAVPAPVAASPAAGLAVPLASDSFMVRILPPSGSLRIRVGVTSGDVVAVRGVGAASRSRFQAVEAGIHVGEVSGGELRISVPGSARRVLVQHGDAPLVEVLRGRFRIHTPVGLEGDSVVFLDIGSTAGSGSDAGPPGGSP